MKSSISRQAISTSRSPVAGSKPVVSVSRTISRAMRLVCRASPWPSTCLLTRPQGSDDLAHLGSRRLQPLAGFDDEVGALALLGVGHLLGQDGVQLLLRHPGPLEH